MKTINDIVSSLSLEERKLHSDLIAECTNREVLAINTGKKIRKNIATLTKVNQNLIKQISTIQKSVLSLETNANTLKNQYDSSFLSSIPDSKFYKA